MELGEPASRIVTLRNGVDLQRFAPGDRDAARTKSGPCPVSRLLSVGSLIPRKGHELIIAALTELPDAQLLIAGSGPMRAELERVAVDKGVAARVRFLGEIAHDALTEAYRAADIFVLASSREGWANVLLEAMACGTPVVATNVNGTPEVLRDPTLSVMVEQRSAPALAHAIKQLACASARSRRRPRLCGTIQLGRNRAREQGAVSCCGASWISTIASIPQSLTAARQKLQNRLPATEQ